MTTTTPAPATTPAHVPAAHKNEIRIISHSALFYWWPVWALGFLLALYTWADGHRMVVVPTDTVKETQRINNEARDVLVAPPNRSLEQPHLRMINSKAPGVLFCIVLLLVITITNVPLRGLWSVIVISFILFFAIILAILHKWDDILERLSLLDIRINLAGYLVIAMVLFIVWLIVITMFDKQIYMVFTPGQLRVRLEIGQAETAYDTTGMTIQKQRSDLFRHWILGLGSGDLIVNTAGAQAHHFDMPNVLFLGRKVREIEDMLRSRQVVAGQP
jgi:hypothetical protein